MDSRRDLRPRQAQGLAWRLLKTPVWRAGLALLAVISAVVYLAALELDALLAQVLAAFAIGGAFMVAISRDIP